MHLAPVCAVTDLKAELVAASRCMMVNIIRNAEIRQGLDPTRMHAG